MNIAQSRPRRWSPQVILFAVVLHAVVLYYVAVSFNILPTFVPTTSDPVPMLTIPYVPPPQVIQPDPIKDHPFVVPRHVDVPPVHADVPPLPFPPQPPQASTADGNVIAVDTPIPEEPIAQVLPAYPRIAQENDKEGRVVLSITIMPDGSVRDVQIVNAQPRGYFENAALNAVRTWRYRPSNVTRTRVIVHMDFVLRG